MDNQDYNFLKENFVNEKLEPIYTKIQELNQQIKELEKSANNVIVTGGLSTKQPQPVKISEKELICLYN